MLRAGQNGGGQPEQMHGPRGVQRGLAGDDMGLRVAGKADRQRQPARLVSIAQFQRVGQISAFETELRQKRRAIGIAQDQAGLPGKAVRGFGADRQIRVLIQHPAGDVDHMGGVQRIKAFTLWQGRTPIDHLRQAVASGRQHKRLAAIVDAIGFVHGLLLYGPEGQARDKVFLHEEEHQHRRHRRDDCPGRDQLPLGDPLAVERVETGGDGLGFLGGGQNRRPEIVVPDEGEDQHRERRDRGLHQGQDDIDEDAPFRDAFDADQLVNNTRLASIITNKQDAGYGVIVSMGAGIGGWSLYAKDGKLKHCYNFFGIEKYFAQSERAIPAGTHQVRLEFSYDGGGLAKGGTVSLFIDGEQDGQGRVDQTVPMLFGTDTCDVGSDAASPVSPDYGPKDNAFNGTVNWVQIDIDQAAEDLDHLITPEERYKVAMARQ